jgi:hypothetical protein
MRRRASIARVWGMQEQVVMLTDFLKRGEGADCSHEVFRKGMYLRTEMWDCVREWTHKSMDRCTGQPMARLGQKSEAGGR